MKRTFFLILILACLFAMPVLAESAQPTVSPDAPIQVVESTLERLTGGLTMIPVKGDMLLAYNNVISASGTFNEAPDNLMRYQLSYSIDAPKECAVKIVLTGPDGAIECEEAATLGGAEAENTFTAVMLAASDVPGEYRVELYVDGALSDVASFAD